MAKRAMQSALKGERRWFTKAELVQLVVSSVPPEYLIRYQLRKVEIQRGNRGYKMTRQRPLGEMIQIGATHLVSVYVNGMERVGYIERNWLWKHDIARTSGGMYSVRWTGKDWP